MKKLASSGWLQRPLSSSFAQQFGDDKEGRMDYGDKHGPNASLFVWNLSYDTTWQELKDHMRQAGDVEVATIFKDKEGNSKGCGVVAYRHSHEAARALWELQKTELNGRVVRLRKERSHRNRVGTSEANQSPNSAA